jgi:hypothetical protein
MDGEAEIEIHIDHDRQLILVDVRGSLHDSALAEHVARVRRVPEFERGYGIVVDFTETTSMNVTREQILTFAAISRNDVNRVAIIAVLPVTYGMARMYELAGDWDEDRVQVFSDKASALQWLGIPV